MADHQSAEKSAIWFLNFTIIVNAPTFIIKISTLPNECKQPCTHDFHWSNRIVTPPFYNDMYTLFVVGHFHKIFVFSHCHFILIHFSSKIRYTLDSRENYNEVGKAEQQFTIPKPHPRNFWLDSLRWKPTMRPCVWREISCTMKQSMSVWCCRSHIDVSTKP